MKCHTSEYGGHFGANKTVAKILQYRFFWPTFLKILILLFKLVIGAKGLVKNKMSLTNILEVENFDV